MARSPKNNAALDREDVLKLGFAGNVVEKKVTRKDDDVRPWDLETKFQYVGTRVPRFDGLAKATGRAKYTYDVNLPGMLYARFVRSTVAAGTVKEIDLSKALALPGVKAAEQVWDLKNPVRYAGQAVAVVCCETSEQCDDAVRAVSVKYERKPHVVTVDDAIKDDAPQVGNRKNATEPQIGRNAVEVEEIDAALKTAAATVDVTYRTQVQTHTALETHGTVAHFTKDATGAEKLYVWASTQGTFTVREGLCRALKLEANQVEVISEFVGGGFGAKFGADETAIWAARLSKKTGAPVKLMLTRKEEHLCTGNRPDSVQHVRAGCDKDGNLLAWHVRNWGTGGVVPNAGARNPMIYTPRGMKTRKEEFAVLTNCGPQAAMRAPAHPQGAFANEQVVDELAEKLGMDPIAFRLKNDSYKQRPAQYELGKKLIGWERRNPKGGDGPLAGTGARKRGLGVAAATWGVNGGADGTAVAIVISPDGTVEVRNGCQDIGTGTRTLLGLTAGEALGCPKEKIRVRLGHTTDPFGPASGGSVTGPTLSAAGVEAGHAAKLAFLRKLASKLGAEASSLDVVAGKVTSKDGKSWSWDDACRQLGVESVEITHTRGENFDAGFQGTVGGVQLAEVEVDTETGFVRVMKVVAIQDAGTVINRLTFESQVLGGVIQGISYALYENRWMDRRSGFMLNPNIESYKIAGAADMPEIVTVAFDLANGLNSAGVSGLGEPTVIPTAPAIANAIANATGVRVRELPMTPDRVLAALAAAKGGAK